LCLDSNSVEEAIRTLEKFGSASSQHILIADLKNGARGLEVSPLGNVILNPRSIGENHVVLVHTNHFIENKSEGIIEPPWLSGSPIRLERASQIVESLINKSNTITPRLLREQIFSDMHNAPQAICCQEDPTKTRGNRITTLFNIVMIFEEGSVPKAEVFWGRPGFAKDGGLLTMML
jgi:isopenicillin-N N-acyltransferase-like protein